MTTLAPERPSSLTPGRPGKSAMPTPSQMGSGGITSHRAGRQGFPTGIDLTLPHDQRGKGRHRLATPPWEYRVEQWTLYAALVVAFVAAGTGWLLYQAALLAVAGGRRLVASSGTGWRFLLDWYQGGGTA